MTLAQYLAAYSDWRAALSAQLGRLRSWLAENEIGDAQTDMQLAQLLDRLREDRLNLAFVAEFSRGKSELINAIFFATYGARLLPASAGRTTMCPTELRFDPERPPSIALLPIETRGNGTAVAEHRRFPDHWQTFPLDTGSPAAMQAALRHVGETQRVSPEAAEALGFRIGDDSEGFLHVDDDGRVDVPRWRHAVINFPHPLLEQGLVILDTPGLNAIGTEPELTLSLLPNAHAVLFILAADTGVTRSDLEIWRRHLGSAGGRQRGRLVVLNKIDGLWDDLKAPAEVDAEIARQADTVARALDLSRERVFPVSAQKALVARINGDAALLRRSRLPELEAALAEEVIPAKQEIVAEDTTAIFADLRKRCNDLLASRLVSLAEQLDELTELRGKNKGVVTYMMGKVNAEKEEFDAGLQRYYAVRSVFSQLTNRLFSRLGLDTLRGLAQATREQMVDASFSRDLSAAMSGFFAGCRDNLARAGAEVAEIIAMMDATYRTFAVEQGLKLDAPLPFSTVRYEDDIGRLEQWCDSHLNTMVQLLTREKHALIQKFFEQVVVQARKTFEQANRDTEGWIKAIMAPMETQVREHRIHLKRRLESIRRIHQATETLEERISELEEIETQLTAQIRQFEALGEGVDALLRQALASEAHAVAA